MNVKKNIPPVKTKTVELTFRRCDGLPFVGWKMGQLSIWDASSLDSCVKQGWILWPQWASLWMGLLIRLVGRILSAPEHNDVGSFHSNLEKGGEVLSLPRILLQNEMQGSHLFYKEDLEESPSGALLKAGCIQVSEKRMCLTPRKFKSQFLVSLITLS